MKESKRQLEKNTQKTWVSWIFFDDCIEVTNIIIEVKNSVKLYPTTSVKEYYSVVSELWTKYLFHFNPKIKNKKKNIPNTFTIINTGIPGVVMQSEKILIGRKFVWLIFVLHTIELPLWQLINEFDSTTMPNNLFLVSIGKLLPSITELPINE